MNDSTFVKKKMNDSNKILFGLNIKKLRKGLKLNQKLFAKPLGVTGTHISKIEHGKTDISKPLLNAMLSTYPQIKEVGPKHGNGPMFHEKIDKVLEIKSSYDTHQPSFKELLDLVAEIMQSKNKMLKNALRENIVAFHYALQSDKKIEERGKKIEKLEKEVEALKSIINPSGRQDDVKEI